MNPNTIETIKEIKESWEDPDVTNLYIRKSWQPLFQEQFATEDFQKKMKVFQKIVKDDSEKLIFPSKHKIFNAFNMCSMNKVKVVIIGQDVYHAHPNEAQGLCFSVPPNVNVPPSLKRIFKELDRDPEVSFQNPQGHGCLVPWTTQGVLLLNTALTVWQKCPGSHIRYWEDFTDNIIKHISDNKNGIVFMLWGKFAQSKARLIDSTKHCILESQHPSPLATGKNNPFIGNGHFSKANKYLQSNNIEPINWSL